MQHYRLLITGSIIVAFEDGEEAPSTSDTLQALFEDQAVDPYALDNLTLQLVQMTPEEITAKETEFQRMILYAKQVGEQMRRERDNR